MNQNLIGMEALNLYTIQTEEMLEELNGHNIIIRKCLRLLNWPEKTVGKAPIFNLNLELFLASQYQLRPPYFE